LLLHNYHFQFLFTLHHTNTHTPKQGKSIKLIDIIHNFPYNVILYFYYILYYSLQNYIYSHHIYLLHVTDVPAQVSDNPVLTVCLKFMNFSSQIFPPFIPEMSTSCTDYTFQVAALLSFESCNLLLPLALQPAVGFGLSNNIFPFFPICHQLSPSSHS
jgi:hypothetical protein